jgi:hypothetical protein
MGWTNGGNDNTGDRRQETGVRRRETGDRRRGPGDGRQETGDGRRETGDTRHLSGTNDQISTGIDRQVDVNRSLNSNGAKDAGIPKKKYKIGILIPYG